MISITHSYNHGLDLVVDIGYSYIDVSRINFIPNLDSWTLNKSYLQLPEAGSNLKNVRCLGGGSTKKEGINGKLVHGFGVLTNRLGLIKWLKYSFKSAEEKKNKKKSSPLEKLTEFANVLYYH